MLEDENVKAVLDKILQLVSENSNICTKAMLTTDEAAIYMGISKSQLYKLMMRRDIPYYKPMGKVCYFKRVEIEEWLQQNRCATEREISDKANKYCMKGR